MVDIFRIRKWGKFFKIILIIPLSDNLKSQILSLALTSKLDSLFLSHTQICNYSQSAQSRDRHVESGPTSIYRATVMFQSANGFAMHIHFIHLTSRTVHRIWLCMCMYVCTCVCACAHITNSWAGLPSTSPLLWLLSLKQIMFLIYFQKSIDIANIKNLLIFLFYILA